MSFMNNLMALVLFGSIGTLIFSIVKKNRGLLKKSAIIGVLSFFAFGATAESASPSIDLSVDKAIVQTNVYGNAEIKGHADKEATIQIDQKNVPVDKKGYFNYVVQLKDKKVRKVQIQAELSGKTAKKEVAVEPGKAFLAMLEKENKEKQAQVKVAQEKDKDQKQKAKKVAEDAVILAEKEPTREHYKKANELVAGLKETDKILKSRLSNVLKGIENKETEEKAKKAEEIRLAKEQEEQRKKEADQQKQREQEQAQQQQAAAASQPNTGEQQYVDANGNGLIKGSNNGIYHVPGSTYYNRTTNPAAWFKTVSEAEAAGYRAPAR